MRGKHLYDSPFVFAGQATSENTDRLQPKLPTRHQFVVHVAFDFHVERLCFHWNVTNIIAVNNVRRQSRTAINKEI